MTSSFAEMRTRWSPDGPEPPPPSMGVFCASLHTHRPLTSMLGSATCRLWGEFVGSLLSSCVGQKGGAPGHERADTLAWKYATGDVTRSPDRGSETHDSVTARRASVRKAVSARLAVRTNASS